MDYVYCNFSGIEPAAVDFVGNSQSRVGSRGSGTKAAGSAGMGLSRTAKRKTFQGFFRRVSAENHFGGVSARQRRYFSVGFRRVSAENPLNQQSSKIRQILAKSSAAVILFTYKWNDPLKSRAACIFVEQGKWKIRNKVCMMIT